MPGFDELTPEEVADLPPLTRVRHGLTPYSWMRDRPRVAPPNLNAPEFTESAQALFAKIDANRRDYYLSRGLTPPLRADGKPEVWAED